MPRTQRKHMLTDYYRERNGDYCAVFHHDGPNPSGLWPGRGPAITGLVGSMASTSMGKEYLRRCRRVDRREIPPEWRRALDGPDSGLATDTVEKAARPLWACSWSDAWREAGGSFAPGTALESVCPDPPAAALDVVRTWVAAIDASTPYPLADLMHAIGADDACDADGALFSLMMGCIGHGINLDDWLHDHAEESKSAAKVLGCVIDPSPCHLESWPMDDIAQDFVRDHPPAFTGAYP